MPTNEYNVADELSKLCDEWKKMYETEHAKFLALWDGTLSILRDPELAPRHHEKLLSLLEDVNKS